MIKLRLEKPFASLLLLPLLLASLSAEAYWYTINGKRVRIHTSNGDPIVELYFWAPGYKIAMDPKASVETNAPNDKWSAERVAEGPTGKPFPHGAIHFTLSDGAGIGPEDFGDFYFDVTRPGGGHDDASATDAEPVAAEDTATEKGDKKIIWMADERDTGNPEKWRRGIIIGPRPHPKATPPAASAEPEPAPAEAK